MFVELQPHWSRFYTGMDVRALGPLNVPAMSYTHPNRTRGVKNIIDRITVTPMPTVCYNLLKKRKNIQMYNSTIHHRRIYKIFLIAPNPHYNSTYSKAPIIQRM